MEILSIDISASSGRFIVCSYENGKFSFEETFRFPTAMEEKDGHLRWPFKEVWEEQILKGLKESFAKHPQIASVGIDTFGVDFGLLDENDNLIADPIGYRDWRNKRAAKALLTKIPYAEIYKESGIQYLTFNSLFQLYDVTRSHIRFNSFLLMPDLINFYLTGKKFTELTNLSTTALYNPKERKLSEKNLKLINLNPKTMAPIIYPGQLIGTLKKEIADQLGIPEVPFIAVGSHDTASAVASVNLDEHTAYLSSGTWSLMGVELKEPIITVKSLMDNCTNEIGLDHTVRFLKNIMGLFIVQELKKDFEKEDPTVTFQMLQDEAKEVKDNKIFINVDDDTFSQPGEMKDKYMKYLTRTNQYIPHLTRGQIVRSIYESMCEAYLKAIKKIEEASSVKIEKLIIVGGGANVTLLNQMVADKLNLVIETGEKEATVCGNALCQFIYWKQFKDLKEARQALYDNSEHQVYKPNAK